MNPSHEKELQSFLEYAYENTPAVKSIFDSVSLSPLEIQTIADLEKVPITSKDRLAELQQDAPPFGGFLAIPQDQLEHVFLSPGPLYEPHAGSSPATESVREMLKMAGFSSGDVVLNTFGYHLIPTGLAVDEALRDMGATIIAAGVGNIDLQLKMAGDFDVTGYVGTPSWLMALIQKAEEMGLNFREQFSLKKVLVSAEPMPPSMRQAFVEKYGLNVTNAYGTAELGFLAYDKTGNTAMSLTETSIIQIANPDTGETVAPGSVGEVVVTSFNKTYPLIRLGTGDLAMNVDPAPGSSRQGERSIILVGRVGDAVKVRGMFLHPNQLRFAIAQTEKILRFQAVISRPENRDEFTLRLVTTAEVDQEELKTTLSAATKSACRLSVDHFEFLSADSLAEDESIMVDTRTWK